MSVFGKLYRGETAFDFVRIKKPFFIFSAILIAISVISLVSPRSLKLSVDFTGGTIVDAPNATDASVSDVRAALSAIGQDGARVQITSDESTGASRILVQTESLGGAEQDRLVETVSAVAGTSTDSTNLDAVGPTFGAEITRRAVEALVIFLLVVAAFISWRFEWKMAAGALAALFHDLIITAGIYSVVGFEVTPATVIAILTILGYSLYDTVVVFDKIGENVHELHNKHTFTEIANLSMNQVLMRSINTSLTTLLPIGSLLFIGSYLLGAATLREFALALFIGVAAGTYSSIFVATPLLVIWKEREPDWQRMQRRVGRRDGGAEPAAPARAAKPLRVNKPASATATIAPETAPEAGLSDVKPRPPRKRKKKR